MYIVLFQSYLECLDFTVTVTCLCHQHQLMRLFFSSSECDSILSHSTASQNEKRRLYIRELVTEHLYESVPVVPCAKARSNSPKKMMFVGSLPTFSIYELHSGWSHTYTVQIPFFRFVCFCAESSFFFQLSIDFAPTLVSRQ